MIRGAVERHGSGGAFRGVVAASGFVLDVAVLGEAECAARVRAVWTPGTDVRTLPDGRWLVRLPEPVEVRAEQAPGLPLVTDRQALVSPGVRVSGEDVRKVVLAVGGVRVAVPWVELPEVPASRLVDVSGLDVRRLTPIGTRRPEPSALAERAELADSNAPDLRVAAGVGDRHRKSARIADEFEGADLGAGRGAGRVGRIRRRASRSGGVPATRRGRALAISLATVLAIGAVAGVIGIAWALATDDPSPASDRFGGDGQVVAPQLPALPRTSANPAETSPGFSPFADNATAFALRMVAIAAILAIVFAARHGRARSRPGDHGDAGGLGVTAVGTGSAASGQAFEAPGAGVHAAGRSRRRGRRRGSGGPEGPGTGPPPRSGRLRRLVGNGAARLVMRSPARGYLHGRHARYVQNLTEAFRESRWDDALRDAVAVGGSWSSTGLMSLRVPRRRTGPLRASPNARPNTATPMHDISLLNHLRDVYRDAARRLEHEARLDEAAFVYADLLGAPLEAVTLYERHSRWREAAQLAEGRNLAPELAVRLWWRAGERGRAVDLACLHGVFANAVSRVARTDPAAANELRAAWVASCQASGDRLGAVEAAWPHPALWPAVKTDIADGVAQGGPVAARLTAYLAASGREEEARAAAASLLDAGARPSGAELGIFLSTLAEIPGSDAAFDRELATAGLRALAAVTVPLGLTGNKIRTVHSALAQRADPLAAADILPPGPPPRTPAASGPVVVRAEEFRGAVELFDAVALPGGQVLLALGEAGTRLVDGGGRTRVHWDVPAHRIVPADHCGTALLVAERGNVCEIARLDLVTRVVRRWASLRERVAADSYDGAHLVVHALDGGLAVVDTTAATPRVVWRELGRDGSEVVAFARMPESCAALVRGPSAGEFAVWRWSMPGWTLRSRPALEGAASARTVSALGAVVSVRPPASRLAASAPVTWEGSALPTMTRDTRLPAAASVSASGAATFVIGADGAPPTVAARMGRQHQDWASVTFPGAEALPERPRHHADLLTVWDRHGRVVVLDADRTVIASLRTRP